MPERRRGEGRGRPLRALGFVLGGWVAVRAAMLWPDPVAPLREVARRVAEAARPVAVARAEPAPSPAPFPLPTAVRFARPDRAPPVGPTRVAAPLAVASPAPAPAAPLPEPVLALAGMVRYGNAEPAPIGPSRWSGSGWAILRGTGASGVATPQLGGSQAGVHLAYVLDQDRRFAIAARAATAIGTRQQEVAIGVEWRPTRLPVRLVAEQRLGIAGVRGGPGVGVVGGVSAAPLPLGLTLDGYGQAGAIARDGGEGYADGTLRVARPVARGIDLGVGAWGAAQKGAHRLDIGPSVSVAVPLGGQRVRATLDWRQRVAGSARPGSGLALSLGTDF